MATFDISAGSINGSGFISLSNNTTYNLTSNLTIDNVRFKGFSFTGDGTNIVFNAQGYIITNDYTDPTFTAIFSRPITVNDAVLVNSNVNTTWFGGGAGVTSNCDQFTMPNTDVIDICANTVILSGNYLEITTGNKYRLRGSLMTVPGFRGIVIVGDANKNIAIDFDNQIIQKNEFASLFRSLVNGVGIHVSNLLYIITGYVMPPFAPDNFTSIIAVNCISNATDYTIDAGQSGLFANVSDFLVASGCSVICGGIDNNSGGVCAGSYTGYSFKATECSLSTVGEISHRDSDFFGGGTAGIIGGQTSANITITGCTVNAGNISTKVPLGSVFSPLTYGGAGAICGGSMGGVVKIKSCGINVAGIYSVSVFGGSGGVCGGRCSGVISIDNCSVTTTTEITNESTENSGGSGGIIGGANNGVINISNCNVMVGSRIISKDTASGGAGGICGGANDGPITIAICTVIVDGSLYSNTIQTGSNSGGICGGGNGGPVYITDCSANIGINIMSFDYGGSGGICGGNNSGGLYISNCYTLVGGSSGILSGYAIAGDPEVQENLVTSNLGSVGGSGGICGGLNYGPVDISNCRVRIPTGGLVSNMNGGCGGICGGYNFSAVSISSCSISMGIGTLTNTGRIRDFNGGASGGIIGGLNFGNTLTIRGCVSIISGTISLSGYGGAGGICGGVNSNVTTITISDCSAVLFGGFETTNNSNGGSAGICGGLNNSIINISRCVADISGTEALANPGSGGNGGICGGTNTNIITIESCSANIADSVVNTGQGGGGGICGGNNYNNVDISSCTVNIGNDILSQSSGNVTNGGGGGICGGNNRGDNPQVRVRIIDCSANIAGSIRNTTLTGTSNGGGGGICGGKNGSNIIITGCRTTVAGDIVNAGIGGGGGICGGSNDNSVTITSCSSNAQSILNTRVGGGGGICGGRNRSNVNIVGCRTNLSGGINNSTVGNPDTVGGGGGGGGGICGGFNDSSGTAFINIVDCSSIVIGSILNVCTEQTYGGGGGICGGNNNSPIFFVSCVSTVTGNIGNDLNGTNGFGGGGGICGGRNNMLIDISNCTSNITGNITNMTQGGGGGMCGGRNLGNINLTNNTARIIGSISNISSGGGGGLIGGMSVPSGRSVNAQNNVVTINGAISNTLSGGGGGICGGYTQGNVVMLANTVSVTGDLINSGNINVSFGGPGGLCGGRSTNISMNSNNVSINGNIGNIAGGTSNTTGGGGGGMCGGYCNVISANNNTVDISGNISNGESTNADSIIRGGGGGISGGICLSTTTFTSNTVTVRGNISNRDGGVGGGGGICGGGSLTTSTSNITLDRNNVRIIGTIENIKRFQSPRGSEGGGGGLIGGYLNNNVSANYNIVDVSGNITNNFLGGGGGICGGGVARVTLTNNNVTVRGDISNNISQLNCTTTVCGGGSGGICGGIYSDATSLMISDCSVNVIGNISNVGFGGSGGVCGGMVVWGNPTLSQSINNCVVNVTGNVFNGAGAIYGGATGKSYTATNTNSISNCRVSINGITDNGRICGASRTPFNIINTNVTLTDISLNLNNPSITNGTIPSVPTNNIVLYKPDSGLADIPMNIQYGSGSASIIPSAPTRFAVNGVLDNTIYTGGGNNLILTTRNTDYIVRPFPTTNISIDLSSNVIATNLPSGSVTLTMTVRNTTTSTFVSGANVKLFDGTTLLVDNLTTNVNGTIVYTLTPSREQTLRLYATYSGACSNLLNVTSQFAPTFFTDVVDIVPSDPVQVAEATTQLKAAAPALVFAPVRLPDLSDSIMGGMFGVRRIGISQPTGLFFPINGVLPDGRKFVDISGANNRTDLIYVTGLSGETVVVLNSRFPIQTDSYRARIYFLGGGFYSVNGQGRNYLSSLIVVGTVGIQIVGVGSIGGNYIGPINTDLVVDVSAASLFYKNDYADALIRISHTSGDDYVGTYIDISYNNTYYSGEQNNWITDGSGQVSISVPTANVNKPFGMYNAGVLMFEQSLDLYDSIDLLLRPEYDNGDPLSFNIKLTNGTGAPIAGQTLRLSYGTDDYTGVTDVSGTYSVQTTAKPVGGYIIAPVDGTTNARIIDASFNLYTYTLNITPPSNTLLDSEQSEFIAQLTSTDGGNIGNRSVHVNYVVLGSNTGLIIYENITGTTDTNGYVAMPFTMNYPLGPGDTIEPINWRAYIESTIDGAEPVRVDNGNESGLVNGTMNATVWYGLTLSLYRLVSDTPTYEQIESYNVGDTIYIVANLSDTVGRSLIDHQINITYGSNIYSELTDISGKTTFIPVTATADGVFFATMEEQLSDRATISPNVYTYSLDVSDSGIQYYENDTVNLVVQLSSNGGDVYGKSVRVTPTAMTTITATTDIYGTATISILDVSAGNLRIATAVPSLNLLANTTVVINSGPAPCFLACAPVLTPTGYTRISRLAVGDEVVTGDGRIVKIQSVKKMRTKADPSTNPYIIEKGQFGANTRLLISPSHRIHTKKGFVEAQHLGLTQEEMKYSFDYYNLELPDYRFDTLVVAGVTVESLHAPHRIVISREQFNTFIKNRYGELTPDVEKIIARTCRYLTGGRVEVPANKSLRK